MVAGLSHNRPPLTHPYSGYRDLQRLQHDSQQPDAHIVYADDLSDVTGICGCNTKKVLLPQLHLPTKKDLPGRTVSELC
jgi:hypothetical protein